jgi:predicted aldo/keto reductase-like oxidoreductase
MKDNHRAKDAISRRRFIGRIALGGLSLPFLPAFALDKPATATDTITLPRSGITISRLGIGTGSNGGRIQRELGQEGFTRVVRHAFDRGITFFDTADNYNEMHEMLGVAVRDLDRERIQIQTKISWGKYEDPLKELDRFRKEVGTDYFDSILIHCVMKESWPQDTAKLQDLLSEAKQRGWVKAHGVSIHGLKPLAAATANLKWPDHFLLRVNHNGHHMDGPTSRWAEPGDRDAALPLIKKLHDQGAGIIGMKLIGNGDFTDVRQRRAAINFVMGLNYVDTVVIGFKSPAEIDEAIGFMNTALAG